MQEFKLSVESDPPMEDMEEFWKVLKDYNISKVGPDNYAPLAVFLRDSEGKVQAGLNGSTYYSWLYVDNLAVAESIRRKGFGSRLLQAAEQEAVSRGCKYAYCDTFSFQSLLFFERHGYVVFATLDDFPAGHKRYFLKKTLHPKS